jgi:N-acyl-D-amino-acid deacylase
MEKTMKTLLKNALVYDGSGEVPFKSDVLLDGERIAQVGENLDSSDARILDLEGLSLSPGFIDAHSHNDWFVIKKEPKKYFEPFVRQGIASFISGNCGLSATGFEESSEYKNKMGGGLFHLKDNTDEYPTLPEYFEAIDRKTPVNTAMLMGHCSARTSVAGYDDRPLTDTERKRMLSLLEEGLKAGACGISLGLMYTPGLYAPFDELKEVAQLCEKYDVPLTVHPRALSAVSMAYPSLIGRSHLLRALDELEEISKGTKMKLQYSHALFVGKRSLKYKDQAIEIVDRIRKSGVDIMFDIFVNDVGASVITVIMPVWYQALSSEDKRKPFNKLRFTLLVNITKTLLGFGFDNIQIAYAGDGNEQYEGKTVHEIAVELGLSDIDAYLHVCEASDFAGRVLMSPQNTRKMTSEMSQHDHVLLMTDAWVEDKGQQYQAIYDCFPKFLHLSLNGQGDTFTRTIRKMTGATADRFSLIDRGYIKPGYFADVTIFDEDKLKYGTPDKGESFGIETVFINGNKVLDAGALDETAFMTAGHALRSER